MRARRLVIVALLMAATAASAAERGRDVLARLDATDVSGRRWTAGDLRGRVVLIDFWATWCAPCLADLPGLKRLRARHARADFEIVGVSLDATGRRSLVSWLNRNRIEWPQINEPGGYSAVTVRLFGVDRLPSTILVDHDGSIAATNLRGSELIDRVDALIAAKRARDTAEGSARP
jgi:thiol-disulfide isomerase/thioredoxin